MIFRVFFIIFIFICSNSFANNQDYSDDFFSDNQLSVKEKKHNNDPFEKINRKIFNFNDKLDQMVLRPIAISYRKITPKIIRNSVRNFLKNIQAPLTIVNSLAQVKIDNSMATTSSFLINSTIGIFGFIDVANNKRITYNKEDFGQTLSFYNFPEGPFLMLPLFGPSNFRDFNGLIITKMISPYDANIFKIGDKKRIVTDNAQLAINAVSVIDKRESLIDLMDEIRVDSFDLYSTIKSAYIQNRNFEINR